MTIETDNEKRTRLLRQIQEKINASPIFTMPTSQEELEGMKDLLKHQLNLRDSIIFERIKAKSKREEKRRQQLINESNKLKVGEPDKLARLHYAMNSKNPISRNQIFDADLRFQKSKRRKAHGIRGDWGKYKNQTRGEFADPDSKRIQRGYENLVNLALTDSEIQDRQAEEE